MLWLKKYGIVFAKICKDFPENGLGSCVTEITSGPITAGLFFFNQGYLLSGQLAKRPLTSFFFSTNFLCLCTMSVYYHCSKDL